MSGFENLSEDILTPLQQLERTPATLLDPTLVQTAINSLDPNSASAVIEAEVILGIAAFGQSSHPEDSDWSEVFERALKIYNHRLAIITRPE